MPVISLLFSSIFTDREPSAFSGVIVSRMAVISISCSYPKSGFTSVSPTVNETLGRVGAPISTISSSVPLFIIMLLITSAAINTIISTPALMALLFILIYSPLYLKAGVSASSLPAGILHIFLYLLLPVLLFFLPESYRNQFLCAPPAAECSSACAPCQ